MSEKLQCRAQWQHEVSSPVTRWWGTWRGVVTVPLVIACTRDAGHDDRHGGWIVGTSGGQERKLHVRW